MYTTLRKVGPFGLLLWFVFCITIILGFSYLSRCAVIIVSIFLVCGVCTCMCSCVCANICEDPCACEGQRSTLVSSLIAFHIIFFKQDLSLNVELADSSRLADQQGLVAPLSSTCTTPSTGPFLVQCLTLQAEPIMESLGWEKREFVRPVSSVYVKLDTLAHNCSFK